MDAKLPFGRGLLPLACRLASHFETGTKCHAACPVGPGLINATFRIGPNPSGQAFILQALNPQVFAKPAAVMHNTLAVLNFLELNGHSFPTLPKLVRTRDGGDPWIIHNGILWRCWHAIEPSICYETVQSSDLARAAGAAFGAFHADLKSFPVSVLQETIPLFHHTPSRLNQLETAAHEDPHRRLCRAEPEFDQLISRRPLAHLIQNAIDAGDVPLRTTHNDTKISNVLFHPRLPEALCIIDLDTLMPGTLLHDFGDLVRTSLAPSCEDEASEPTPPALLLERFRALTHGFLEHANPLLTQKETSLLASSAAVITYELATRFLSDFLSGDRYFSVSKPDHNLLRCRSQLALLKSLESILPEMQTIVAHKSLQNYPI